MEASNNDLMFSVVVPVYNHWHLIPKLLTCLKNQTLPQKYFEVILVENGSSSIKVPLELADNVKIVNCSTPGSYAARNQGVEVAQAQWLCFTDADCMPKPAWLTSYYETIQQLKSNYCLLCGPVSMTVDRQNATWYAIYDKVKGIPQKRYFKKGYAATANLVVSKRVFDEVGGFDSLRYSGGDAAFCLDAQSKNAQFLWVEDGVVDHPARSSWQEIETKARRVKGGQWHASNRYYWLLRTLFPPILEWYRFLKNTDSSVKHRLIACFVQSRVWYVEINEITKLLAGRRAERK